MFLTKLKPLFRPQQRRHPNVHRCRNIPVHYDIALRGFFTKVRDIPDEQILSFRVFITPITVVSGQQSEAYGCHGKNLMSREQRHVTNPRVCHMMRWR